MLGCASNQPRNNGVEVRWGFFGFTGFYQVLPGLTATVRLPINRGVDDAAHVFEPPLGPAEAPLPPLPRPAMTRFFQPQFKLAINIESIIHAASLDRALGQRLSK
jgi:hypothetical protein